MNSSGPRILLVAAEEASCRRIQRALEQGPTAEALVDWLIPEAGRYAAEAFQKIDRDSHDICILDARHLDEAGVLETARRGRIPSLIALFEAVDPQFLRLAARTGAVDCLPWHELGSPTFERAVHYALERRRLIDSEHRFRSLIEGLNEGIMYCDLEDRVVHINGRAAELFGYRPDEMVGQPIVDLVVPTEERSAVAERNSRRMRGESERYEMRLKRRDGSRFWADINATPMRNAQGEIIGSLGGFIDITQKKAAEEALRQSEQRLRHYFESSLIGIAITSPDKRWLEVNDCLCRLLGCSRDDLRNLSWLELTHPEDRASDVRQFDRLVAGEIDHYSLDKRFLRRDGTVWHGRLSVGCARGEDRELEYVIALIQDITEQKLAEEALRNQKEFLRQVIDSNTSIIFATDIDGRFVLANRAFAQMYGRSVDQIIGCSDADLVADAVLLREYEQENRQVIATRRPLFIAQVMMRDPETGTERWFQGTKSPLIALDGRSMYVLCVATEITERKRAEDERIRLQRQLLQSQKMEAIGQLAAGVAHDLNNALAAVVGHLQLLAAPGNKGSVETALAGCRRASGLIEQLLGFSRQGKYNLEHLCLQKVVAETLDFVSRIIDKNIEISTAGEEEELFFEGDQAQVQQALTNLIINARQAMPEGGRITLRFAGRSVADPQRFNPGATAPDYVTLAITDTGTGIDGAILDKIFEPFFTTRSETKGTGLGLSMVYGIMQNHGGWIEVESRQGVGTTFTLFFPRSHLSENPLPAEHELIEERGEGGGTILVIDDEPPLVQLAEQFLTHAGFTVQGFSDSHAAISWYTANAANVDLVILDMKMPRLDGRGCFAALQQINPAVRIVILSGYSQDAAAQDLLERGALKFFQKPLRYPELVEWVSRNVRPAPTPS